MRIWIASVAAVAVQPFILAVRLAPDYFASPESFYGIGVVILGVVVVAGAAVLLLGLPTFLLLQRYQRASWASLSIAGFVAGTLPVALSWPSEVPGYSAGQNWHGKYIVTYTDGIPTTYAWLTYAENVLAFGIHGLVGALVFYAVWRSSAKLQCQ